MTGQEPGLQVQVLSLILSVTSGRAGAHQAPIQQLQICIFPAVPQFTPAEPV